VTDLGVNKDAPEFHLVVRRPGERSPLAPYRFTLSVLFSLLVGGTALWDALAAGPGLDAALARVLVAALFAWIVLGLLDRVVQPARNTASLRAHPGEEPIARTDPPAAA
jgi:hypothetical protein